MDEADHSVILRSVAEAAGAETIKDSGRRRSVYEGTKYVKQRTWWKLAYRL